jgi:hypothetical protein
MDQMDQQVPCCATRSFIPSFHLLLSINNIVGATLIQRGLFVIHCPLKAPSNHMIHSEIYTFNPSSLFPLFSLTTRWRLDRHWSFLDILPISAKRSASTLLEAFHHCPFGVIVGISEQILEELVQRAIAAHVGVICARFRLLGVENGVGHAVPVYTGLWKGRTGLCGRSGVRSGRIGKSWSVT